MVFNIRDFKNVQREQQLQCGSSHLRHPVTDVDKILYAIIVLAQTCEICELWLIRIKFYSLPFKDGFI